MRIWLPVSVHVKGLISSERLKGEVDDPNSSYLLKLVCLPNNIMTLLKTWKPCEALKANGVGYNYAILILNRPITIPFSTCKIINLWKNAMVRITVDGGTDRWLMWLQENNIPGDTIKQPDLVTGDMDSIKRETLEKFKNALNCTVICTDDDSETDFTKALKELKKYSEIHHKQIDFVFTTSEQSGRFDQMIGNINTLYKAISFWPNIDVFIIETESLSWLLWTGSHKIHVSSTVLEYSNWCSLIPFGSVAYVTTTGLKWNLSNTMMAFGAMVSTSNTFTNSSEITVTTDSPLLWSMGINPKVIV